MKLVPAEGLFCSYLTALAFQQKAVEERIADKCSDMLLLVEHEPVVTLGSTADRKHLLLPRQEYARRGIRLIETDRGGDVTYHGPGQVVMYPIVKLQPPRRDVRRYVRFLEQVAIDTLSRWGIKAFRSPGKTGVWTERGKIAAIGVRIRRWVTCHGLALNVATDLSAFDLIVPCGLHGEATTSMEEFLPAGRMPSLEEVASLLAQTFKEGFGEQVETVWGGRLSGNCA